MEDRDNSWVYFFFAGMIVLVLVLGNVMGCESRRYSTDPDPPGASQYP